MEHDSSGGLAPENRAAPRIGGMNERSIEHGPEQRGWIRGVIVGFAAVLTLGALGYFYFNRDTGTETASVPATEQAPSRASDDVAAAPPAADPAPQQVTSPAPTATPQAETPPSVTAAPAAPTILSPPPGAEAPAAQTDTAAQTQTPAQTRPPAQAQPPAQTEPTAQAEAPVLPPPGAGTAPVESAAQAPRQPDPLRNQPASLPADDVMFVQKPRVNIRSEPGMHGRIVGSASEGDQFKVVGRSGTWVQVEGDGRKGWISGRLLGPQSP